ncbi:amino acid ABC transporter permease [Microbacterium saperdae]|uniref:Amino acid ABC transporter membrane protein (PAAT family) n=1 Tax=Microbacterium saperdae TaxID=69368 RepID=A0A543BLF5_9MICO|nr:amino acid ABC transporter permease [Microbacterium saperdae]TQL85638.1 amino acid ABC transporter membrane protein (PAAT family) [Microbacterium saperdae]GGM62049.1 ABC transporter permease [Microbacterium saperdae]
MKTSPPTARISTPLAAPRIYRRLHFWRWVSAIIVLAAVAGIIIVLAGARIQWPHVLQYVVLDTMAQAAWNTVLLAVAAQLVAVIIGVIIAIMRISRNPVAISVATGYIWIFRGVPVLVQILVWYNLALVVDRIVIGVPFTNWTLIDQPTNAIMTAFTAALLGLALNESAYMAEIIRGGLKGIDSGQTEAAHALGMSPMRTLARIILPQAMRIIIPPTGNNFINMLKTTSLASVVTYFELVKAAANISSRNLEVMETLFAAAVWYMIIVTVASIGQFYLERAFDGSTRRGRPRNLRTAIRNALVRPPFSRRGIDE